MMSSKEQDYYEILGVPRDASEKEIRDAYHKLAMKWHPDRNKSSDAEQRFKEIARAYAILKDPKKRAQYDSRGLEGIAHYTPEDLFGDFDFGDLWRTESIGIADAVLGMTLTVTALQGKVDVPIPAGIQPDEVLHLRGKGLPRFKSAGQGDLNLRIQVNIPAKLTEKQRQLYQQLRELDAKAHE